MNERQILKAVRNTQSYKMSNYKSLKIESLTQIDNVKYEVELSFKAKKWQNNRVIYILYVDNDITALYKEEQFVA